jgi:hypothetical protein
MRNAAAFEIDKNRYAARSTDPARAIVVADTTDAVPSQAGTVRFFGTILCVATVSAPLVFPFG